MIKLTSLLKEGNWSKMMAGVRRGSQTGPGDIVVIKNNKVVEQESTKIRDSIPAHFEHFKKEYNGQRVTIAVEDGSGQIVYSEKI